MVKIQCKSRSKEKNRKVTKNEEVEYHVKEKLNKYSTVLGSRISAQN